MALNDELKKTVLIKRGFTKTFISEVSHKCGVASQNEPYNRNDSVIQAKKKKPNKQNKTKKLKHRTSSFRTTYNDIFINNK